MRTKQWILTFIAGTLLLSGCLRASPVPPGTPEPTLPTSSSSPTSTPMYLNPLVRVNIFPGGHGWASNLDQTRFYNTRNFGEHWLTVTPANLSSQDSGWGTTTSFPNGDIAWLCQSENESAAKLYSTTNGGRDWQIHNLSFSCGQVSFLNSKEGYILSDEGVAAGSQYISLYHTADGGQSWDLRFSHDPADPDDHGLPTGGMKSYFVFLNSNIGLVGGSVPVAGAVYLYRTINGGTSWNTSECQGLPLDLNQETSVDKIIQIDATSAVLPIRSYSANGNSVTYFCSTSDGAETWKFVGLLENVEFLDFGTLRSGVAYGQSKMFQTEDGGATWIETTAGLPPAVSPLAVDMMTDYVGFLTATVSPETLDNNRLYMTGNNGKDWQSMPGNIIESITTTTSP